jgi:hypothetical protein
VSVTQYYRAVRQVIRFSNQRVLSPFPSHLHGLELGGNDGQAPSTGSGRAGLGVGRAGLGGTELGGAELNDGGGAKLNGDGACLGDGGASRGSAGGAQ